MTSSISVLGPLRVLLPNAFKIRVLPQIQSLNDPQGQRAALENFILGLLEFFQGIAAVLNLEHLVIRTHLGAGVVLGDLQGAGSAEDGGAGQGIDRRTSSQTARKVQTNPPLPIPEDMNIFPQGPALVHLVAVLHGLGLGQHGFGVLRGGGTD